MNREYLLKIVRKTGRSHFMKPLISKGKDFMFNYMTKFS